MAHALHPKMEQQLRDELKGKMGIRPYSMWFANTTVQCSDESIDIHAATPLAAGWIQDKFSSTLQEAARSTYGREVPISVEVREQPKPAIDDVAINPAPLKPVTKRTGG